MNYTTEYIKRIGGSCVHDFLKPFLEKYDISIDVEKTSKNDNTNENIITLKNNEGSYCGRIIVSENGNIKFNIYLTNDLTSVLSGGVMRNNYVFGALEKMDSVKKNELVEFTTFYASHKGSDFDITQHHYKENVPELANRMMPLNWTFDHINALFVKYPDFLIADYEDALKDASPEIILDTIFDYTQNKDK